MNVLYKYCCTYGIERILEDLELKMPFISDVNDPLECTPHFYYPDDDVIESSFLFSLNGRILPATEYKRQHKEYAKTVKSLKEELPKTTLSMNESNCMLSVSKTAQNIVMWAHYAERHKGAVIGIDFDNAYSDTLKVTMQQVEYSENRPKINVLKAYENKTIPNEIIEKFVMTKSDSWRYEEEYRRMFDHNTLIEMKQQGLVNLKKIKPEDERESWLLKLNPASIKEIIFGLHADDLKEKISKLKERQHLQHIQLRKTEVSETYDFNIKDIT